MPLFAVLFEDEPALAANARNLHMADHLAFLDRNGDKVRAAGPLCDSTSGASVGGLWLVEATDYSEAYALVQADPFWPTGLRRSVRVLAWRQVFSEGCRVGN